MSRERKLQKAKHEYGQFIKILRGSPARNSELFGTDPPYRPMQNVPRKDVLAAFLREHPEYKEVEDELKEHHKDVDPVHLVIEEWEKVKEP